MATFVGNGGKLDEQGFTRLLDELFTPGFAIRIPDAWSVVQDGSGTMNVVVKAGAGLIEYGTTYTYPAWADADVTLPVTTADVSNPRRDIVVAYIELDDIDNTVTNNPGALVFKVVAGTPAASPADPNDSAIQTAVGPANPWIKLSRLAVAAGATGIVTSDITPIRSSVGLRAPVIRTLNPQSTNVTGGLSDDVVPIDCSAASRTYTLPDATRQAGRTIMVYKSDTSLNTLTVARSLGQTINTSATDIGFYQPMQGAEFLSNGSNWILTRWIGTKLLASVEKTTDTIVSNSTATVSSLTVLQPPLPVRVEIGALQMFAGAAGTNSMIHFVRKGGVNLLRADGTSPALNFPANPNGASRPFSAPGTNTYDQMFQAGVAANLKGDAVTPAFMAIYIA